MKTGDTSARLGAAVLLGGVTFVISFNAGCSELDGPSNCVSIMGTAMPQVNRFVTLLVVAVAAVTSWLVLTGLNRIKIAATSILGGVLGLWLGIGLTVLLVFTEDHLRGTTAIGGEGWVLVALLLAAIGFLGGLFLTGAWAVRRWDAGEGNA